MPLLRRGGPLPARSLATAGRYEVWSSDDEIGYRSPRIDVTAKGATTSRGRLEHRED